MSLLNSICFYLFLFVSDGAIKTENLLRGYYGNPWVLGSCIFGDMLCLAKYWDIGIEIVADRKANAYNVSIEAGREFVLIETKLEDYKGGLPKIAQRESEKEKNAY